MMIGRKIFILGSGDIGLIMARRMTLEGANVLGVAEIMPYSKGLPRNIMQCLKDFNIPLHLKHTIVKIEGKKRLEAIIIAEVDDNFKPIANTEQRIECDTLLISAGLIPENTLAEEAGIALDAKTKGAQVNEYLQTQIQGIFSCGNGLHVHDIVDNVTAEARKAGQNAAIYIKGEAMLTKGATVKAITQTTKPSTKTETQTDITCRICPNGCKMRIGKSEFGREPIIIGNKCPKGRQFAIEELTHPVRTLTTTVKVKNSSMQRLPVKSSSPLPKNKIFEAIAYLKKIEIEAPIKTNQIICQDMLNLGVNIIASCEA